MKTRYFTAEFGRFTHAQVNRKNIQKRPYSAFSALFLSMYATISRLKERLWQFGISAKTAYLAVGRLFEMEQFSKQLTQSLTKKLLPIEKILLFDHFFKKGGEYEKYKVERSGPLGAI